MCWLQGALNCFHRITCAQLIMESFVELGRLPTTAHLNVSERTGFVCISKNAKNVRRSKKNGMQN